MAWKRFNSVFLALVFSTGPSGLLAQVGADGLPIRHYSFVLEKGKGAPVCEAYAVRLRESEYTRPPYCDRPEVPKNGDFAALTRVPLPEAEIVMLYDSVEGFLQRGDEHYFDTKPRGEGAVRARDQQALLQTRQIPFFYRFEPRLDIDNDGKPDDLVVWKESGLRCGAVLRDKPERASTQLVLLDAQGRLDTRRTTVIFGHPKRSLVEYSDARGRPRTLQWTHGFRGIGDTFGAFVFRGETYFDTFYMTTGDLDNARVDDRNALDTLAVLQHRNGNTRLVCEIRWLDPDRSERP